MIERINAVKKVGLFADYTHSPECDFGQVTLIYGENGVGKSTLAAIFDSLRERNPGEIIRRRSLPGDAAPIVSVTLNSKTYNFDGIDWDDQPPHDTIDVFFPGFVSRNVHAGSEVDSDHRRNLCEFVLGREAVKSVKRLADADGEARVALAEKNKIEGEIKLLIKKPDTLETFLELTNDPDIDVRLEQARHELIQIRSKEAILAKPIPQSVQLPLVDPKAIYEFFARCAESIGANVAEVVRDHIRRNLDSDGENWLAYGAKHIEGENNCPFCAQSLSNSALAKAIRAFFSDEYQAYADSVLAEIQELRHRLGSAVFSQTRTALSGQIAVANQWTDEIAMDQAAITAAIAEAENAWKGGAEKLGGLVTFKQAQPLKGIDPSLTDAALADYERAIAILDQVNQTLLATQKKASERKATLSKADASAVEERVHRLENQKLRFEPLAQELLGKRNVLIERRSNLDEEKKRLKKAIDDHAARVVGKYQSGINYYLNHFGCDIRIESVEPRFPSGKASVQYKLKAHGYEIPLGISSDGPCFEIVLSEGDKYTLALSFFFARLKACDDLTGRVVVLDDPVNSLGSSRRGLIEGVIRELHCRGAQVVVLTHDDRLAAMIWRDKRLNKPTPVTLQVERTGGGSRLGNWDIERAMQSKYVRDYLTLVDFLENGGDHTKVGGCIRTYLEQRLRYLHPGPPFLTRDSLGEMIGRIRRSKPDERLHALKNKLADLESINDATLSSHHAIDDVPGLPPLTPQGVRLFAQKVLDVLG